MHNGTDLGNRKTIESDYDYDNLILLEQAATWALDETNQRKIISNPACTCMVSEITSERYNDGS